MKTFVGQYYKKNFVYASDVDALKAQLISIINTPLGSRFYCPSYGSHLNEYRFNSINYFTIHMIGQEIKNTVQLMNGVSLSKLTYYLQDNQLYFNVELIKMSEKIKINLQIKDGVAL